MFNPGQSAGCFGGGDGCISEVLSRGGGVGAVGPGGVICVEQPQEQL